MVLCDESRFCLRQSYRRQNVSRRTGERAHQALIIERHISLTPRIMVWEAMAYDNRTELVVVQETMNVRQYVAQMVNNVTILS